MIFRYNFYQHVGKTGMEKAFHGQAAIRLDDAISGVLIYCNVFDRCANGNFGAIQMNSGRDNIIDNNLFIDCKQGISGGWYPGNNVWKMLREGKKPAGFHMGELYKSRYPGIDTMCIWDEELGKNGDNWVTILLTGSKTKKQQRLL